MPLPAIATGLGALFSVSTLFKATLIWFVVNVFGKLLFRVLFSLGIGVITYGGVDFLVGEAVQLVSNGLGGLSGQLEAVLNRARVAEGLSIIFSAGSFALTTTLAKSVIGFRGRPNELRI